MVFTEKSSFRDPSARILKHAGIIYRDIKPSYWPDYDLLMKSGLYDKLVSDNLMIAHSEMKNQILVIKPEQIEFISYPYEWSFNTLKQAAIVTLKIAIIALEHGMLLKDASAYNIQYHKGNWKLIDTTSFEEYKDGMPWYAYGQFVRHFYMPLVLASYHSGKVLKWLQSNIDGLNPQDYVDLLPIKSYFNLFTLLHLHSTKLVKSTKTDVHIPKKRLINTLYSLLNIIEGINYKHNSSWQEYRVKSEYILNKEIEVNKILTRIGTTSTCDIGTNDSYFSSSGIVIDKDHDCINTINKLDTLPLVVDICNPSPAIGWGNKERKSFLERANFDTVLALAIVHHLCIANNTPIEMVAQLMAGMTKKHLIIEYVSLDDENSKKLALGKVYPEYNNKLFEDSFCRYFSLIENIQLTNTRSLYWFEKR